MAKNAADETPAANDAEETQTPSKKPDKGSKKGAKASKKDAKGSTKDGKGKGKGGRGRRAATEDQISVASHPRAGASVSRAKAWGGLAGFLIAGLLSLKASVPVSTAFERALVCGIVAYLLTWALSIFVWRQLILAEQRAAIAEVQRQLEERRQQAAQAERPTRRTASAAPGART